MPLPYYWLTGTLAYLFIEISNNLNTHKTPDQIHKRKTVTEMKLWNVEIAVLISKDKLQISVTAPDVKDNVVTCDLKKMWIPIILELSEMSWGSSAKDKNHKSTVESITEFLNYYSIKFYFWHCQSSLLIISPVASLCSCIQSCLAFCKKTAIHLAVICNHTWMMSWPQVFLCSFHAVYWVDCYL